MFLSADKYRLDLNWESVFYDEGICYFNNAYFSGPVLQLAEKIESNNNINLDFYKQYFILIENVYIGKLSWGEVVYKNDIISLNNCILTHSSEINKVPKLKNTDRLIIDCQNHERETHDFFINYKTYVVNEDRQVYNYES